MKRIAKVGLLVLALVLVLFASAAARRHAQGNQADFRPDIVYGKAGGVALKLDLALPKNAGNGPFPAVVFIHGGGWKGGNRQQHDDLVRGAATLGYVGATVEYRLLPKAVFPAQIEDCKAAIRYLRANAAAYHLDPNRIGVVGFSAGGHLVCLLGLTRTKDGLEGSGGNPAVSSQVQAVADFYGPTDFLHDTWDPRLEKELIVPLLGGTRAEKSDTYRRASPITYVHAGAPPFLIVHGTKDPIVPVEQSRRLAKQLKKAGVPVRLRILEGQGHGVTGDAAGKVLTELIAFLNENLKPVPPALTAIGEQTSG